MEKTKISASITLLLIIFVFLSFLLISGCSKEKPVFEKDTVETLEKTSVEEAKKIKNEEKTVNQYTTGLPLEERLRYQKYTLTNKPITPRSLLLEKIHNSDIEIVKSADHREKIKKSDTEPIEYAYYGEKIKILEPEIGPPLDFSPEYVAKFNAPEILEKCIALSKMPRGNGQELTPEEKEIYKYCDLSKESVWDIMGEVCSWYCGGWPEKITASSFLGLRDGNNYVPANAHDNSYRTAWIDGVQGDAIGENLKYYFRHGNPRITKVIVVNGYVKSDTDWKNYSRVKQFKMYVNEKPYAVLNLKDVRAEQIFDVGLVGYIYREYDYDRFKAQPDWPIKFEITDIYKGNKFNEVVVTEIYFDGTDVHCFVKGTKITMADGSVKNIEDVGIGDKILTYNFEYDKFTMVAVEAIEQAKHSELVTYEFENGLKITGTQDHPFFLKTKGWSSLKPDKSANYKGFENVKKIEIGDYFKAVNKNNEKVYFKLISIKLLKDTQMTFTISKLEEGNNFIANNLVTGVEENQNYARCQVDSFTQNK